VVDIPHLFFLNEAKNPLIKKTESDELVKNWKKPPQFRQLERLNQ